MDTAEIEVFLVLAEELHFGRTAERLRMPQPRVSQLVRALERRVGGALFERTSRRVALTPLGASLVEDLSEAHALLRAAIQRASDSARTVSGRLRVGFYSAVIGSMLTGSLRTFERTHPDVE